VRGDGTDHTVNMIVNFLKIDGRFSRIYSEPAGAAHCMGRMSCRNHRLGRHAPIVQAIAAHLAAFQQNHIGPHLGSAGSNGQTSGATAYYADIGGNFVRHVRNLFLRMPSSSE